MRYRKKRDFYLLVKIEEFVGKIGTLNLILILVGVFFVWFNRQMIQMYHECGSVPETYACTVVGALIGECGICGWIRTNKDRRRERKWEKQDQKEQREFEKQETAENGGNEL